MPASTIQLALIEEILFYFLLTILLGQAFLPFLSKFSKRPSLQFLLVCIRAGLHSLLSIFGHSLDDVFLNTQIVLLYELVYQAYFGLFC